MKRISTLGKLTAALLFGAAALTASAQVAPTDFIVGQAYNSFTWVTDANQPLGGYPGTCLVYTAPANGVLTIVQANTYDSHLYDAYWDGTSVWDNVYGTGSKAWNELYHNIQPDNPYQSGDTSPYTFNYTLNAGQTVYFYAKGNSADNVAINSSSWAAADQVDYPEAHIGVPFNAYNTSIYTFTPSVSGVMTVKQSTETVTAGPTMTFLYTNPALNQSSRVFPNNTTISSDLTWNFNVEAGQAYYFNQIASSLLEFTILEVKEQTQPTVTITGTYPDAGTSALSEEATWVGGARVYLSPNTGVGIGSAKLVYTSAATGQPVTIAIDAVKEGDGWSLKTSDAYGEAMRNGKGYTYVDVIMEDVTLNGQLAVTEAAVPSSYSNYVICSGNSITVRYLLTAQLSVVLAQLPQNIYGSWEPGDPAAQINITFNNPISSVGEASLMMGSHTYGSVSGGDDPDPSFDLTDYMEIDGATISINLSGLNISEWITKSYSVCTLMLQGVKDIYDNTYDEGGTPALTYYIDYINTEAPEPAATFDKGILLSPADGNGYAIELSSFQLKFPDQNLTAAAGAALTVDVYINGSKVGTAPVAIEAGDQIETAPGVYNTYNEILVIDLSAYKGQYGSYLVNLPQGLVENEEGAVNPAQPLTCTSLVANDEAVLSPEPGEVGQLESISVIYPEGTSLGFNESAGAITWFGRPLPSSDFSTAGNALIIAMGEMEPGEYTLVIPETYLVISGESLNERIEATYIITSNPSAIESLYDANGETVVYSINGVKVGNSLQGLRPGLYIINGKKVLVK